jgi:hypothetical protein
MRHFGSGKQKPEMKPKDQTSWVFSGSGYIVTHENGTEERMEGRRPDFRPASDTRKDVPIEDYNEWANDFPRENQSTSASTKRAYVRRNASTEHRPHECHAEGCTKQVNPVYFMCGKHWNMVPKDLQALIWKHYQPGQEAGNAEVTEEYYEASIRAIDAVARRERRR